MTEPVQPLTWQKRTNHEEHMQFFSKINEIVGQLSGTVERSETALTQATVALAEASAAVTEANTASAAASTAASTVAGYNTRLTAAESGVAANAANIGQLDIETQDLYDRDANSVKLSADHVQTVMGGLDLRGTNRTSDTAVGSNDTQMVNGHRVIQELNAYQPMVRTTGNQVIDGVKDFDGTLQSSGYYNNLHKTVPFIDGSERWYKVYEYDGSGAQYHAMMFTATPRRTWPSYAGIGLFINNRNSSPVLKWMVKGENLDVSNFVMTKEGGNAVTIWCKGFIGSADGYQFMRLNEYASSGLGAAIFPVDDGNGYEITSSGYEDNDGVQHTFTMYKVSE